MKRKAGMLLPYLLDYRCSLSLNICKISVRVSMSQEQAVDINKLNAYCYLRSKRKRVELME